MNLRGLANSATTAVNPNEIVTVLRSRGFTISASGAKQVPKYDVPIRGPANVQALDMMELKLIDGLNLQGDVRAIYLRGSLAGVVRPNQKGGDLIKRGFPEQTWLIVKILETWPTWTKAVIQLQDDGLQNKGLC